MKNVTIESLVAALAPHVTWSEHYEPETDVEPDDHDDAEGAAWIRDQIEEGNEWAWFRACIVAEFAGLEGSDSLGCCSYESEAAWRAPGCYYDDMKATALRGLAEKILPVAALVAEIMAPKAAKRTRKRTR